MSNLKAKLKKEGGFTLVEMLIVVAIIAILIAISIPMVNKALEKSRHAVDQANLRDAIGLANIELLTEDLTGETEYKYVVDPDTHQGELVPTTDTRDAVTASCKCDSHSNAGLTVKVNPTGYTVVANWSFDADGKTIVNTAYSGSTEEETP